ncbi:MAG: 50S ribosomal protein L10 [Phycisphaerales bacterium]
MSKQVKEIILRDYQSRIGDNKDAVLVSLSGIDAISTHQIRMNLAKKDMRVTIVRNSLFKKMVDGTDMAALGPVLTGPSALVYGGNSVVEIAREIVDSLKDFPKIELKGAVLDGQLFKGEDGVKALSKFPTREEALGQTVALILGPAKKLVAQIKGPGSGVAGIIKTIETKLEKGEAIAKVG